MRGTAVLLILPGSDLGRMAFLLGSMLLGAVASLLVSFRIVALHVVSGRFTGVIHEALLGVGVGLGSGTGLRPALTSVIR